MEEDVGMKAGRESEGEEDLDVRELGRQRKV